MEPPIQHKSEPYYAPLSFAQQRLWFLDQMVPDSPLYNLSWSVRLNCELDEECLAKCFNEIIRRHEILRTTFTVKDGHPLQVINPFLNIEVPIVDLCHLSGAKLEAAIKRLIKEEAGRPFDLKAGPLLRVRLLHWAEHHSVLLFSMHHIISDGWSMGILFREISGLYEAFSRGAPSPLPSLPIQYVDFSMRQRELSQGEELESHLSYWMKQLEGELPVLNLPFDYPRSPVMTFSGAARYFTVTETITRALKQLSMRNRVTLFMTLLSAFQTLLYRYSGQEDIIVGSPIANRTMAETEDLIGFFVNTLPLRGDLSGDPSFKELLARTLTVTLDSFVHQDLPFEMMVEKLKVERDLSHSPVFQAMIVFQNVPVTSLKILNETFVHEESFNNMSKFELILELTETEGCLSCRFIYNTDLFNKATIDRMVGHFQTLIEGIISDPLQRISEVPLLTNAERYQQLRKWNNTEVDFVREKCIHELFEEQVQQNPNAVALIFEDKRLTYRELNDKANRLAHFLIKHNVGPEVLVGIYMERSIEMVIGVLGILKAGGAYVPLDTSYPKDRLAFIMKDIELPVTLTQGALLDALPGGMSNVICLDSNREIIDQCDSRNPSSDVSYRNAAYVIYTSGSTGKPKGVLVSHYNVVRLFDATQAWYQFNEDDVWTLFHSIAFDFSVWEIWGAFFYGGSLVVVPYLTSRSPETFLKLLHEEKVTVLNMTPSAFRQLIKADAAAPSGDTLSLRYIIFGGEELKVHDLQPWYEKYSDRSPQLVNMYGITETTAHVTYRPLSASDCNGTRESGIGRPIPDLQVYILDRSLNFVPVKVPGEMYVGGAGVARGYLNRPELTAEKFIPDPFSGKPGARLYKTGDLGRYMPDGTIEFLGRIDHQEKIRGFRVEMGEIEVVLGQHAGVRESVVVAREDRYDDKRLVAYVVPYNRSEDISRELRNFLKGQLPSYMIPAAIVMMDSIPLTTNGKVDRRALPVPDPERPDVETPYTGPCTPTEDRMAAIWSDVLDLRQVGIHDNFFDLGGHSLLATRVISLLRDTFQVEIPLRSLFEKPTVAGLAGEVDSVESDGNQLSVAPIETASRKGTIPLSFAQQRLWFLDQFNPGSSAYNISIAVRLTGYLNVHALEKSIGEILRRHKVLRSTYFTDNDRPFQRITPFTPFKMKQINLDTLPHDRREAKAGQFASEEAFAPFDLSVGPLLRAALIQLNPEDNMLLLTVHHIVSDGWSMGILYRELSTLYEAFSKGNTSPLSGLAIQYSDFAVWQRQWLQGEKMEEDLMFWRKQLSNITTLALPTDRPRPAVQRFDGAEYKFLIPRAFTKALNSLSRDEDVTLFMMLLTAFQVMLYRYTGQNDIVVGTPIANRNRAEIEKLIGFFVNTLVVRTETSGDTVFRNLLQGVKKTLLDAYTHQDIPFEKLVEELQPARDLSRNPLFQVGFALQNVPATDLELYGLQLNRIETENTRAKFDLEVYLEERSEELRGTFVYNTDLFDASTIERMAGHYQRILEGVVANPDQKLSELPLLTETERHQLLVMWNDTSADYTGDKCIHELFEAYSGESPDVAAVVFEGQQLTYRELNAKANQLAQYLVKQGVEPEDPVGICVDRSLDMIVGLMGILKSGGAYVPLDPSYPGDRLSFMLEDAGITLLLSHKHLTERLPEFSGDIIYLDNDRGIIDRESDTNLSNRVKPDNMAYIMYTSGSTGRPKGVVITHHNVVGFLSSYKHVTRDGSRRIGTSVAPFSFDTSVEEIYSNLCYGGTLHIIRPENSSDVTYFADYLVDNQITTTYIVPDFLQGVASQLENRKDLLNLKCVITGLRPKKQAALQCVRDLSDDIRILNAYGPTEVTYGATAFEFIQTDDPDRDTPIGRPFPNYEVYIVDSHLQPVPVGVPGELLIGGVGLARGYLNRPELTLEKFIPHPFNDQPGLRLYRSGDLVRYLADGNIEFLGRIDDQVKVRGYRVEPGEVETVLGQNPDIEETAVIAGDDNAGGKRLIAYYVPLQKKRVPIGELRNALQKKLPEYMVPSVFIMLDALPRMSNGKIDRRALPEPDTNRPDIEDEYISPRNPTEELLAVIWCELLGLKQVGIYDNFFKLGGHSLLATQIVSRLRNDFNVDMPLRKLFEMPTVAGLAEEISKLTADKVQPSELVIAPVSREGKLPLSYSQQRLWFLNQLEPSSSAYNVTGALRLAGNVNADALEKSITEIIRRHEVLRTTFSTENDEPCQRVHPDAVFALQRVDICKIPESQKEDEVQKLAREETSRIFDLTSGPLLRAVLVQLKPGDYVLILSLHHIVSDAWSTGIFNRELSVLYEAFLNRIPSALPDLPVQYADFAVWQRKWLQGEKLEEQLTFWKNYLRDLTTLDLPTDRPRPAVQTSNGSKQSFQLSGELTKALQDLSRKERATIFMTMLAAFQCMLHRYTGQNDIVIGTPIANRNHYETDGLIGFFLNTLVIRADTSGNPAFRKLLIKVRKVLLDAYTHQDLPFEKLVEELETKRDLSRNPLFQVLFTLQNVTDLNLELSGLSVSRMEVESKRTRFDLEVHLQEGAEGLKGTFIYNTNLFEAATIERMAGHYEKLLEGIAADPDQKLSDLPLLTDAEKHQLLVEWNETSTDYPENNCIHELFEKQAKMHAEAAAAVFKDQKLTYNELNRKANQLAHYLRKQGVGPDVPVGICIERSLEMVISVLGILKAGGAYVPLDPAYPKERLEFMLVDAGVQLVITQNSLSGEFPKSKVRLLCLDQDREIIEKENDQNPSAAATPKDLAYVLYTSGSTGKPKGVAMSHRPLCNLISWQLRSSQLSSGAKTLQFASLNFDVSFQEIFSTLCSGGTLAVVSEELRREPLFLTRYLESESIERLFLPFVALQQLAEAMDKSNSFPRSLKEIITAGEQLRITPSIVRMFEGLGECRLYNQYGPTESHVVTAFELSGPPSEWPSLPAIGRPISNAEIYLLDRNHNPVAVGIAGELYIGGECLARGYMNQPEMTAGRFITNPYSQAPGARLYRTGDLARYLPDGNIEYLGRLDHQVKVRGFRVEPGEIETVLTEHDEVKDAVVTAYGDRADNKRLAAYIVRDRKATITGGELRSLLEKKLPDYMVPGTFVFLDELPLTPSGKVDRRSLPVPGRDTAEAGVEFVPPESKLEILLAKIWENVLNVTPVGITDNFFHLGGHSLLAVSLISEINKVTGKDLPVISIFHAPTIVQLTKVIIGEELPGPSDTIAPVQPHGSNVPIFWLTGTYFVRHMEPDQPVYMLIDWDEHGYIPAYSTIEEIAELCIKRLIAERPEGPYILGGYCFWGAVALEVAQRLKRQGYDVPLLFLVGTDVNYTIQKSKSPGCEQESSIMKSRAIHHAANLQRLGAAGKAIYVLQKLPSIVYWGVKKTIEELMIKTKEIICRTFILFRLPVPRVLIQFYVYQLYALKLLRKYIPQVYPGKVVLINSDSEDRHVRPDWIELVEGEVSVHTLAEVKHADLIKEPWVGKWSKWLRLYLGKINSTYKGLDE